MTAKSEIRRHRQIFEIVKGRLDVAEAALGEIVAEIDDARSKLRDCAALLAQSPPAENDPAYALFADRRRAALRARLTGLKRRLASLEAEKEKRRSGFESLLRQKLSIEKSIDSAAKEMGRLQARAG